MVTPNGSLWLIMNHPGRFVISSKPSLIGEQESMSGFVYRSNWCNVPFGFVPSQFALSAHSV